MTTLTSTISSTSPSSSLFDVQVAERELQSQVREALQFQSQTEAADLTKRLLTEAARADTQQDALVATAAISSTPLSQLLESSWRTNPKRLTSGTPSDISSGSLVHRTTHLNMMSGLYPPVSTFVDTIDPTAAAAVSSVHAELSSLHESLRTFQRARLQQTVNFRQAAAQPSQTYFIAEQQQLQPQYLPRSSTPSQSAHSYRALTPAAVPQFPPTAAAAYPPSTQSQLNRTQVPFQAHPMQLQQQQQPQPFSPSSLAAHHSSAIPAPVSHHATVDTASIQQQLLQLQRQQQILMMQLQQTPQSGTPLSSISPPISIQPSAPTWTEEQLHLLDLQTLQSLSRFQ